MSVSSSISSTNIFNYQPQANGQSLRSYVRQLGNALESGDLASAQQIYSSLSQLPQFQNAQGQGDSPSGFIQSLARIGEDLQSGDLASAQQAFSALQQGKEAGNQANAAGDIFQVQGSGHHRHHHHHNGGGAVQGASSAADNDIAPPVNINI